MSNFSRTFRRGGDGPGAIFGGLAILAFMKASKSESKQDAQGAHIVDDLAHGGADHQSTITTQEFGLSERLPNLALRLWSDSSWYHFGAAMACVWVYKCKYRFHMLMTIRYSDICYQLRRPDVLANKVIPKHTSIINSTLQRSVTVPSKLRAIPP